MPSTNKIKRKMIDEDGWISLNGCNACINTSICKAIGNCVLLTVNVHFPLFNKRKRNVINHIRQMPLYTNGENVENIVWDLMDSFKPKFDMTKPVPQSSTHTPNEPVCRTYDGPVRLTVIEKMFIKSLNQKR